MDLHELACAIMIDLEGMPAASREVTKERFMKLFKTYKNEQAQLLASDLSMRKELSALRKKNDEDMAAAKVLREKIKNLEKELSDAHTHVAEILAAMPS